jgi:hypothetical protein
MRFFFDFRSPDQSLFDYQGHDFGTSQGAIEFAEAMVENLRHSLGNEWIGWRVEVRCAAGKNFCSLPVRSTKITDAEEVAG